MPARLALLLAAGAVGLSACGSAPVPAPPPTPPHSVAERHWVDDAYRLIQLLESRVTLAAAGGTSIRSARQALDNASSLYTTLVAYTYFGGCNSEVASVGAPSERGQHVVQTLISACGHLERASALFHLAVTRNQPRLLLRATQLSQAAVPLLVRASSELAALD